MSEEKKDAMEEAVERFIEINAPIWEGVNLKEYMDEVRERDPDEASDRAELQRGGGDILRQPHEQKGEA